MTSNETWKKGETKKFKKMKQRSCREKYISQLVTDSETDVVSHNQIHHPK